MFWFDLLFFVDSWGINVIVPYIQQSGTPRVFQLFSRNLKNEKWIFPLERIVFMRVIDNKVLVANALFEFAFLPVTTKLVLMAFQLELDRHQSAYELIKFESFDNQLTAAKAFLVKLSEQKTSELNFHIFAF